jgi:hypothetical protein
VVTKFNVVPEDITAQQWVYKTDDDILGCRGQGHGFPKIRRGRAAKGINSYAVGEGITRIEVTCRDCGTVRIEDTLPGGEVPTPHRYSYIYPPNYSPPKGVRVSRRLSFDETWRRVREDSRVRDAKTA